MADFERTTAKICNIIDLINGEYIKTEGWNPNYVITNYDKISRANIMGVIVSKENDNTCILDDGTGKIIIRDFNKTINYEIGDLVIVIGKPKKFNEEIFLNAEIVKEIKNKKWIKYRKKELNLRDTLNIEKIEKTEFVDDKKNKIINEIEKEEIEKEINEKPKIISKAETIIYLIEKLDSEEGADMQEVVKQSGFKDCEKIIKNLIEEGEIFQIKPGRLKIL